MSALCVMLHQAFLDYFKNIRKEMRFMNEFLARVGMLSIALLILYIIKKVDDYLYFRREENEIYNSDKDDDE